MSKLKEQRTVLKSLEVLAATLLDLETSILNTGTSINEKPPLILGTILNNQP